MKDRGLQRVELMVADGIKGLDTVIGQKFPGIPLQRCVTHLKRNMFAKVRHGDKAALAADLRDIFRTRQRDYTIEMAWTKWQEMCDRWGKDYRAISNGFSIQLSPVLAQPCCWRVSPQQSPFPRPAALQNYYFYLI